MKREVHFSIDLYFDNSYVKSGLLYPRNVFRSRHGSNHILWYNVLCIIVIMWPDATPPAPYTIDTLIIIIYSWTSDKLMSMSIVVQNNFFRSGIFSDFNQLLSLFCYLVINDKLRFIYYNTTAWKWSVIVKQLRIGISLLCINEWITFL